MASPNTGLAEPGMTSQIPFSRVRPSRSRAMTRVLKYGSGANTRFFSSSKKPFSDGFIVCPSFPLAVADQRCQLFSGPKQPDLHVGLGQPHCPCDLLYRQFLYFFQNQRDSQLRIQILQCDQRFPVTVVLGWPDTW